mmetsp:Transcript_15342/g.35323  ORF Transcript_15342/g.35323 Transcript_15342/m.35323 type:complete len:220 (+) Transcript_15342:480-1139(+)
MEDGMREQRIFTPRRRVPLDQGNVLLGEVKRRRRRRGDCTGVCDGVCGGGSVCGRRREWHGRREQRRRPQPGQLREARFGSLATLDHRLLLFGQPPPLIARRLERLCLPHLSLQPRALGERMCSRFGKYGRVVERPLCRHRPISSRDQQRLDELGRVAHVAVCDHRDRQLLLDPRNLVEVRRAVTPSQRRAAVAAMDGEQRAARSLQLLDEGERVIELV